MWIVDPLDGTKEFIKKNGEFTVNVALVKNNQPIIGVIYVQQRIFFISQIKMWVHISQQYLLMNLKI